MRNYEYDYIFTNDSENKILSMTSSTIQITNSDIVGEDFEIEDILNDEEDLLFGSVYASRIKFGTTYQTDLSDVTLDVSCYPPEHSSTVFNYGSFKIAKEDFVENQGMNKYKEAVGYDALYDILNTNYIDWYNALFPTSSTTKTQKQFRNSFFNYVGITQETITLPNDSMTVRKTVSGAELKGSTILRAICACNGCFGRMVENKFKYIFLTPIAQDLSNAYEIALNGHYISEKHAKYTVNPIDKLIIRDDDTELIAEYPTGSANNPYVMANNFLLYDKTANELSTIAQNIYSKIQGISYVPLEIEVKGNPCFEVGDPIYFTTVGGELVKSYILRRNYVGFQSPHDTYVSNGLETRKFTTESFDTSLYKLYNKTNQLIRNLEHTTSVLEDEVLDPDNPSSLKSEIDQTASDITLKVDKINGQSGDSFSYEMTSTKAEFKNSGNIVLKIDSNGAVINGKVTAKTGYIGNGSSGFTIGNTSIYNGISSMSGTGTGVYIGTDGINLGYNFRVTNKGVANATSMRFGKIKINSGDTVDDGDIIFYKTATNFVQSARLYLDSSDSNYFNIEGVYVDISASDGLTFNTKAYNKCLLQTNTTSSGNYRVLYGENLNDNTETAGARKGGLLYNPLLHRLYIGGTSTGAMLEYPSSQTFLLRASNESDYGVNIGVMDSMWTFCPIVDDKMALGSPNHKWRTVYAINGTINTSDRNEKKEITELNSKITDFVLKLKPVSYKFKVGKRTHFGLIAQDVEETMTELGMTDMDFAGLCKDQKTKSVKKKVEIEGIEREIDVDEPIEGQYTYGLRYEEFIAPLIYMVQKLQKEVEELKGRIK